MEEENYDQFGNYIGPQLQSEQQQVHQMQQGGQNELQHHEISQHKIVLHEDKKYYESHQELYPNAQIMIQQQDRDHIDKPIIQKKVSIQFDHYQHLNTHYHQQFLYTLINHNQLIRNVAVVGHLHHGKTSFMDLFVQHTHINKWNTEKQYRWMDVRKDQQERGITIKAKPITLLLQDYHDKHYVCTFIDTPGHTNFIDEVACALRLADGVLLLVDAIEGSMMLTEKAIHYIVRQRLSVILVVNKIDRLIVEEHIPPEDAYLKIRHIIEQINSMFSKTCHQLGLPQKTYQISPILNNVLFSSSKYGFIFSLQSIAQQYKKKYPQLDTKGLTASLSRVFWGDYYFSQNKFHKLQPGNKRSFVQFILEPLYKIFSHVIGKDRQQLQLFLASHLNIALTPLEYKSNIETLMKIVLRKYFDSTFACFVSALIRHIPSPQHRVRELIGRNYNGSGSQIINKCDNSGPLYAHIIKMYHSRDYKKFNCLAKVINGTLSKGMKLRIMGENYNQEYNQDSFQAQVQGLYLSQGRYNIALDNIPCGNLALIEGIDHYVTKTATITTSGQKFNKMEQIKFWTEPIMRIAIEPIVPNQLPKMVEALRRVNKAYPILKTKVQESGEHILIGNGQLQLDCILHDIRNIYNNIEVKISDPSVCFSQTISQTSGIMCFAFTPNRKNILKALASPLQRGVTDYVQKQLVDVNDNGEVAEFLQRKFNWDLLECSHVWAWGPQIYGSNALINDSLPTATNQNILNLHQSNIVKGFKWSTKQGPLCDQPMRNVKFRLTQADLSALPGQCAPGQLIPTARRVFYSAFLTANPRMMEPVFMTQIQCTTSQSIEAVYAVLAKRRGAVQNEMAKPGTPHYVIKALIPCIEAIGFETDLRMHTVGQAFCVSLFDHWQTLHGDPLDKNIIIKPLQVMQPFELAREFMIKTRRRKGLNEQVSILKYFDDHAKDLLKNDAALSQFL